MKLLWEGLYSLLDFRFLLKTKVETNLEDFASDETFVEVSMKAERILTRLLNCLSLLCTYVIATIFLKSKDVGKTF